MSLPMRAWASNPKPTSSWLKPKAATLPKALRCNMDTPSATSKRSICPSCTKPPRTCLCNRFQSPPLDNCVSVTILQHSLETNHPLNSTRIAKLGLKNVVIANVSDVLTEDMFVLRLMEDGPVRNGSFEHGVKMCRTQTVCKKGPQKMESIEEKFSENVTGDLPIHNNSHLDGHMDAAVFAEGVEAPTITVTMGSYGSQCTCELQLLPQLASHKLSFDQLLAVPHVVSGLANGFLVKRMGCRKSSMDGSFLEQNTEFVLNVPRGSVLLFPSENAVDVKELRSSGIEAKNLIVLDGTWAKATRMYNENPWLKALPHLKLQLDKSSLYGEVRTQPKEKCLSSIESIVYALKAVGDAPEGLDGLLDVFESMVEDQRRCMRERLSNLSNV